MTYETKQAATSDCGHDYATHGKSPTSVSDALRVNRCLGECYSRVAMNSFIALTMAFLL